MTSTVRVSATGGESGSGAVGSSTTISISVLDIGCFVGEEEFVSRTRFSVLHAAPQSRDPSCGCSVVWAPALQRTASQVLRAALRPGHAFGAITSPRTRL